MSQKNENRLRQLERTQRPPPCREVSFGYRCEEEFVALIALGRAALAGDVAAERLLNRALAAPPGSVLPVTSQTSVARCFLCSNPRPD